MAVMNGRSVAQASGMGLQTRRKAQEYALSHKHANTNTLLAPHLQRRVALLPRPPVDVQQRRRLPHQRLQRAVAGPERPPRHLHSSSSTTTTNTTRASASRASASSELYEGVGHFLHVGTHEHHLTSLHQKTGAAARAAAAAPAPAGPAAAAVVVVVVVAVVPLVVVVLTVVGGSGCAAAASRHCCYGRSGGERTYARKGNPVVFAHVSWLWHKALRQFQQENSSAPSATATECV